MSKLLYDVDGDLAFLTDLRELAPKWKAVGDHLGVPDSELEIIQLNNSGHVDTYGDSLRDMFKWWLRNGDTKAQKLAEAVHKVGEHGAEVKINTKFGEVFIQIIS